MRHALNLGLITLLAFGGPAAGASATTDPPPDAATASASTIPASVAVDLDDYIAGQFAATHIPGMSIELVSADTILFSQTYGDVQSLDTPLIIGSLSKSVTAVAIMQLVERGKITLDNPIADYLPDVDQKSATTVRQLLTQTSGIATNDTLVNYMTSDTPAPYEYANTNYALLGQVVQNVSGEDYGTYVREHIAEPLGMTHTATSLAEAEGDGLAPGHRNYFGAMVRGSVPYPTSMDSGWITVPAGYIAASANDMGRYLQMLLGNRPDVLSADAIAQMTAPAVKVADGYAYGMGLGLQQHAGGQGGDETWLIHGGNVENYTSYMILVPSRGIAAIALFDACDFLVANDMAITLTENIVDRYLGNPTTDLDSGFYASRHALIDGLCAVVVLLALLPLLFLRRWAVRWTGRAAGRRRGGRARVTSDRTNARRGARARAVMCAVVVHVLAPTLILLVFPLMGEPLWQVRSFAPDVFLTVFVAAGLLYAGGVVKLILRVGGGGRRRSAVLRRNPPKDVPGLTFESAADRVQR